MKLDCETLRKALSEYRESEGAIDLALFDSLGSRIRRQGHLNPEDLFTIIAWKSDARFAVQHARGSLAKNPPERIKDATAKAFASVKGSEDAEDIRRSLEELTGLEHVGIPIATAILTFFDPLRFAAMDQNAWFALGWKDGSDWEPDDYVRYLERLRAIGSGCGLSPREVDCALYWLGGRK